MPFPDEEFLGQVTKIGSEASQTTRTYPVTVEAGTDRRTCRFCRAWRPPSAAQPDEAGGASVQDLVVPPSAVFTSPDEGGPSHESYVWVVDEGSQKVARRKVKTGKLTPAGIAVTEGSKPGEWVVTAGVHSLREDQQVRILQEGSR